MQAVSAWLPDIWDGGGGAGGRVAGASNSSKVAVVGYRCCVW